MTNENVIRGELILDEGDPLKIINLEKSIAEIKARNILIGKIRYWKRKFKNLKVIT